MKEGLLVKALDGQLKTPALVLTDDKYSKSKSAAMVVRGLNTNLKTLGNHWKSKITGNSKKSEFRFTIPCIYLSQK